MTRSGRSLGSDAGNDGSRGVSIYRAPLVGVAGIGRARKRVDRGKWIQFTWKWLRTERLRPLERHGRQARTE